MTEAEYLLPYVPKGAWLEERYIRCGKRCRCRSGDVHGTYWRLVWRERGRRRQRYIPSEHVALYTEALERRRVLTGTGRSQRRSIASVISRARVVLRSTGAGIGKSSSHLRMTDELDDQLVLNELYELATPAIARRGSPGALRASGEGLSL